LSTGSHNSAKRFDIEERRRRVASLLARSLSQTEIARQIGVDQSTISDDVKALKVMSQRFIFDLAKSDLGFYYKSCLDGIDEAKKEAWQIYQTISNLAYTNSPDNVRAKLTALKVVIQAEETKFKLLSEGPNVLAVNAMSERLDHIEQNILQQQEEVNNR
jgi:IS30 family transposase